MHLVWQCSKWATQLGETTILAGRKHIHYKHTVYDSQAAHSHFSSDSNLYAFRKVKVNQRCQCTLFRLGFFLKFKMYSVIFEMFTYADRSLWIVELRVNAYDFMNSTTFERPMKNRHRSVLKCEESTCCRIEHFSGCYKLRDSLFLFFLFRYMHSIWLSNGQTFYETYTILESFVYKKKLIKFDGTIGCDLRLFTVIAP